MTITAPRPIASRDWRRSAAFALWSGSVVTAAVVCSRYSAGALTVDLAPAFVCVLTLCGSLIGLVADWLFQRSLQTRPPSGRAALLAGGVTLAPPFVTALLLMPVDSAVCTGFLGGLFVLCAWVVVLLSDVPFGHRLESGGKPPFGTGAAGLAPLETISVESEPSMSEEGATWPRPSANLLQWMQRTVTEDGGECIEGATSVRFEHGQRETTVHLSFVPPLVRVPEIECEDLDDGSVMLKVAAVYPFGARLQVKRPAGDREARTVQIGFVALSGGIEDRAA